jgi:predicted fused transcriptional regulator/phosphomethylpyrimidine kinase/predicted transcriptional regulator
MLSKTFLPAIRGVVVHRLRKQGIGQPTIAKLTGVTQAAVSQILRKDENKFVEALVEMGLEEEEIHLLADTLCRELSHNPARATGVLYGFWRGLLSEGRLCAYHRRLHPELEECDICMNPSYEKSLDEERLEVLRQLDVCVKKLTASRNFVDLIPEVGVNIVYCVSNPQTINDVAGVAGRIVAAGNEVKSVGRPAFGASKHLASVLLASRMRNTAIRSAINISNNARVKAALHKTGLEVVEINPVAREISDEEVVADVAGSVGVARVTAVLHGGGIGIEPITYIFADEPSKLVDIVLKIAEQVLLTDLT